MNNRSVNRPVVRSVFFRPVFALSVVALGMLGCQKLDPGQVVTGGKSTSGAVKAGGAIDLPKIDYTGALTEEQKALVVATVDGQNITQGELLNSAGSGLFRMRTELANKEYMTLRKGLEELIDKQLLEKEAQARGTTPEELIKTEVGARITPASDEELLGFFEQNRRRFPPTATFEEHREELREVYMGRKGEAVKMEFLKGLREKSAVKVTLPYPELPTVQVSVDDDPRLGTADAPVTIIEWSDFQCPYCKKNGETLKKVKEHYGDKVAIVFRDFPLPFHDKAQKAGEASECADEQGKFWEYHDQLFQNQSALDIDGLKKAGEALGLDMGKFSACLDSGKFASEIAKDLAEGQAAGVTGTPASFINGKMVSGALPMDTYMAIIDSELTRKGVPN